jgi:hypothetical protein
MELNKVKVLLEKYYEGSTSLEEEKKLRDYFRNYTVPEELACDKELFLFSSGETETIPMSAGLEQKLEQLIDRQHKGETKTKQIQLWYKVASIAAGLAILLVCYLFISKEGHENKMKDTYTDPQIAYAQVKQTLLYISETLNKGTKPLSQVSKLNQGMEQFSTFSSFGSGLKQLDMVSKYYDQTNNENNKN